MSTVGENILILRKRLGWTQEELAIKMGYKSKSTINKIELGINDIPQSKIAKFAEVLGTTPGYLMGWVEDVQENNSPEKVELSEGERMWLELYHRVSGETRDVLINMMDSFDKASPETQQILLGMIRGALGGQK